MKTKLLLVAILFITPFFSFSNGGWSSNPFDQKVFIENRGQFENDSAKILFGAVNDGVELYFSTSGLTYKYREYITSSSPITETVIPMASIDEEAEKEEPAKLVSHFLTLEWMGANPNVKVISEELVQFYYTYGNKVKANAFKKIIYKNLYPNIDVEYIFPSNKSGIKYSLILHPGANPADIKMKWNGDGISLNSDGNLIIKSSFGEFIDHAPKSFYENGEAVSSAFQLNGNTVSFNLLKKQATNNKQQTIIIDPWTTSPIGTFGTNKGYDINYDNFGNVYVYGSWNPNYQLAKFDSSGALQWIYNVTTISGYGDFTVDKTTGNCYITEGWKCNNCAPIILKVNTFGGLMLSSPLKYTSGDQMWELWRAEFNECDHTILIMGGTLATGYARQAVVIDTNLNTITYPQPVINTNMGVDIAMGAIDKYNCCKTAYMLSERSYTMGGPNVLAKFPLNTLMPPVWSVNTNHKFFEGSSVWYVGPTPSFNIYVGWAMATHGFNGIAISPTYVYTYDSDSLKRWNKSAGTLVDSMDVSPTAPVYAPSGNQAGEAIWCKWGGLDVDECDNIYAGLVKAIKVYDKTFALFNTYNLPDTVYDLRLGPNNKLYACGKGYVMQIDNVTSHGTTVTVSQTPATNCNLCNGTANVNATTSCGPAPSIDCLWSPGGQTTQSISGLCAGTYTVAVSVNCVTTFYKVTVGGSPGLSVNAITMAASCGNSTGSASASITGGTYPFTYLWSNGGTAQTISALSAGTYFLTVTDANGCIQTTTAIVAGTNIKLNFPRDYYICEAGSVMLTASGGTTYTWSPGSSLNDSTIANPVASPFITTTYTVTVSNGVCTDTAQVTVHLVTSTVPPAITRIGDTLSVTAKYISYQWFYNGSPIAGATNSFYLCSQSGSYAVQVTDSFGCKAISSAASGCITGINESGDGGLISIYPNPAEKWFEVRGLKFSREARLEIYNVLGEKIYSFQSEITNPKSEIKIDVSALAKGIYFIQLKSDKKSWITKLVKQ